MSWLRSVYYRWLGLLPPPERSCIVTNWGLRAGKPWRIL